MNIRQLLVVLPFCCALTFAGSMPTMAVEGLQPASIEEPDEGRYPQDERRDAGEWSIDEGLVEVTYMVGADGKAFEPLVLRSTMDKFIQPALDSVMQDKTRSGSLNGKPVDSRVSKTLYFKISRSDLRDSRGSTAGFLETRVRGLPDGYQSYYDQFTDELNASEPDLEKAQRLIDTMAGLKHQSYYGISYLELARFRLAEQAGDELAQIDALANLIWADVPVRDNHKVLKDGLKSNVESNLIKLQIENGQYAEALINYARFSPQNPEISNLFADYIARLEELRVSDSFTRRDITLNTSGSTHLPLFKRSFVLDEINGAVSNFKVRCDAKFANLAWQADAQYQLPESWGQCLLEVIGEPGTTAALLQQ